MTGLKNSTLYENREYCHQSVAEVSLRSVEKRKSFSTDNNKKPNQNNNNNVGSRWGPVPGSKNDQKFDKLDDRASLSQQYGAAAAATQTSDGELRCVQQRQLSDDVAAEYRVYC